MRSLEDWKSFQSCYSLKGKKTVIVLGLVIISKQSIYHPIHTPIKEIMTMGLRVLSRAYRQTHRCANSLCFVKISVCLNLSVSFICIGKLFFVYRRTKDSLTFSKGTDRSCGKLIFNQNVQNLFYHMNPLKSGLVFGNIHGISMN